MHIPALIALALGVHLGPRLRLGVAMAWTG